MTAGAGDDDYPGYRPNVGIVLFNDEGRVWLGKRARTPAPWNWQFPQGGVDKGEDLHAAALRELAEETGVTSVSYLGRTEGWIAYDFPPEARKFGKWVGQKQVWFAMRFLGDESEVRLDGHEQIEFEAWRWARLDEAPQLIIPFKRTAYEQVAEAFSRFARS
jgi:putative (di)nucleoside polyphosphate hydrolase